VTETQTFQAGDKVTHRDFGPGEVILGPLKMTFGATAYAVRTDDGVERSLRGDALKLRAVFTVGDIVTYDSHSAEIVGGPVVGIDSGEPLFLIKFTDGDHAGKGAARRASQLTATGADTYTHDGVTYDLTARYRDCEGDVYEFSRTERSIPGSADCQDDGSPVGRMTAGWRPGVWNWSLAEVVRKYGPLTRVND